FKADVSRKALTGAVREVTDGETSGLSYGLRLSGPVVESLSYAVALKINRYKFDDEDLAIDGGKDLSTDETHRTLMLSLINQF
ncbi:MAG: hypothetical protein IME93_06865, partial [Proteobacteria bacterium]|nr:hypothetical protein [Pseudomonadota bacterium]